MDDDQTHYRDEQDFWDKKSGNGYVSLSDFDQQRIRQWIDVRATDLRVLDLGGGSGMMGKALRLPDLALLTCLDISREMLRHSASPAVQGDALRLPFRSAAFDLVIAAAFLHHVPGLESRVLAECARVLKPGGRIFGYDPSARCIQNRIFMSHGPLRLKVFSPDERPIHPEVLRDCVSAAGFADVSTRYFSFRNARITPFEAIQRWAIDPLAIGPLKPLLLRWFFWSARRAEA